MSETTDRSVCHVTSSGWNSWNHFRGLLSEDVVKRTTEALISTGLAAKGYKVRRCSAARLPPPCPIACQAGEMGGAEGGGGGGGFQTRMSSGRWLV